MPNLSAQKQTIISRRSSYQQAILTRALMETVYHPEDASGNFENFVELPNKAGFVASYKPNFGAGRAIFFNLFPGAILIKLDGKYKDLEAANSVAVASYINSKVFSLRISERGNITIRRGSQVSEVNPQTAVLSCYENHSTDYSDRITSLNHTFNHFVFNEDGLRNLAKKMNAILPMPLSAWLTKKDLSTVMHTFKISKNLAGFARSLNLQSLSYPNNREYIKLKYKELFLLLSHDLETQTGGSYNGSPSKFSKVQTAKHMLELDENLMISTQSMSDILGLQRRVFANNFKNTYGQSFAKYSRMKRLERAKVFLEQECHSVREVAELCGYTEISNFSRAFQNQFGITPNTYRK